MASVESWNARSLRLVRPWECSLKVNLLQMIRFLAERFFTASGVLQEFIDNPYLPKDQSELNRLHGWIGAIRDQCELFGLNLSLYKAREILFSMETVQCNPEILKPLLGELHERIEQELASEWFKYIPRHKASYLNVGRFDIPEIIQFGFDTQAEFVKAGDCYALGMNTATVFHLMRIVDAGLKSAAKSLGIKYSTDSWNAVGAKIREEMEKKYTDKTADWRKKEPLYSELLTDIGAIGKAHRNPALHDLKVNYSEEEAQYLMTVVEAFIRHLSQGGLREA